MKKIFKTIYLAVILSTITLVSSSFAQTSIFSPSKISEAIKNETPDKWGIKPSEWKSFSKGELLEKANFESNIKAIKDAAAQNDTKAKTILGIAYSVGVGVEKNLAEAEKLFLEAAKDNSLAKFYLGALYHIEYEQKLNPVEAVKWYKSSAEDGNLYAMVLYATLLEYGYGVKKDSAEALKWITEAANQGHLAGIGALGKIYYVGHGVEVNYKEAAKWLKISSDTKAPPFMVMYGNILLEGAEGVPKDINKAINLYKLAAEAGDEDGINNYANINYDGELIPQNVPEALKWFRIGAEKGNPDSMTSLASLYILGEGVEANPNEAFRLASKAAEKNNSTAQYLLGSMYANGIGTKENPVLAKKYITLSAEAGVSEALDYLKENYNLICKPKGEVFTCPK